jgi:hypothetical protein
MLRRLEKRLAVKHRSSELARYCARIARLEAFHRAAEAECGPVLGRSPPDFWRVPKHHCSHEIRKICRFCEACDTIGTGQSPGLA